MGSRLIWPDALLSKVRKGPDCWAFAGNHDPEGYATQHVTGVGKRRASRLVYEALIEPIPDGLTIDHICRNKGCVNPDHLEPVTIQENLRRRDEANRRDSCPRGHDYSPRTPTSDATGSGSAACVCETGTAAYRARKRLERAD